ncbi:Cyclochlorotine biosynthesis protein O [Colletotrichum siamense]|uniref:Cyclochlorotine biosynthesis protein O n=1 Tax=Colletotrichum siamense TaxID=690259 RepID=UPI001872A864|nr:Cyclochlorotine biosynthesis protein O [Colletotrichum siamense]KAF5500717.1 Cyclochlorotine biosynthesis protein O [Colletotrichum siamense]
MWWKFGSRYESLPQAEGKEAGAPSRRSRWFNHRWPQSNILLITTNSVTLIALIYTIWTGEPNFSTKGCTQTLSTPSPALEAIKYKTPEHYNAEFRQTNKWRGPPGNHSNAVDVAWHEIELGAGGIWVSEEEVNLLNMTDSAELPFHKIPEEQGGGYLAMLEVFHLLHCLNSLRMGLFYNYEHYKFLDEDVPDENIYTHYDHCIDMLRMNLMCYADVTPALFVDPLNNPLRRDALPNWSSMHTCRDFDAILDWNKHGPRSSNRSRLRDMRKKVTITGSQAL